MESKQLLVDSLSKRVDGMKSELEPLELAGLEAALRSLDSEQEELRTELRSRTNALGAALEVRRLFEMGLEDAKAWLKGRSAEVERLGKGSPLTAANVEKEIQQFKVRSDLTRELP